MVFRLALGIGLTWGMSLGAGASPLIGASRPQASKAEEDSQLKLRLRLSSWLGKSKTLEASLDGSWPEREQADPNDALNLPEYTVTVPFSMKSAHFRTFKIGPLKLPRPAFNAVCYLVDDAKIMVTEINQKDQNLLGQLVYPSRSGKTALPDRCADGEVAENKICKSGKPRAACPNNQIVYIDLSSIRDERDRREIQDYIFNSMKPVGDAEAMKSSGVDSQSAQAHPQADSEISGAATSK